ncbi:hypothetical protein AAE02nite_45270 [Adhaeribacter aerolatus]|uniref:Uncharacterized protein n=1 Tax=Adhaeribacter aerolatus TaxID=670289 RepID=A0A512B4G9_9BACT|nr:hypothetical protein [Adhaeribacter aerolatus]GEO06863.1 hypothetical protein AAE02nite_45270 [Adhaeribacter aerolatus]
MRLIFKIFLALIFCSVVLYGFNGQSAFETSSPIPLATTAPANTASVNKLNENLAVKIADLPKEIKESSGIEEGGQLGTFYTHNDANNPATLYKIDDKGNLLATINLSNAENIDWEDLTRDDKGNIYISDTGNNSNKRLRLRIYKLNPQNPEKLAEINFEYADRKNGTADKTHYEFDCEALFWHQNKLHLVTKDREDGVLAKLYELPDQPGDYEAKLIEKHDVNLPVTAADISPDGKTLLLLSKGKIHLFHPSCKGQFFSGEMQTLNLGKVGQTEAAVFTGNKTVVITNENGQMYRYNL